MTEYTFSGKIHLGNQKQPFERKIEAESEKHARDKLYSVLGSEHSVSRSKITLKTEEA